MGRSISDGQSTSSKTRFVIYVKPWTRNKGATSWKAITEDQDRRTYCRGHDVLESKGNPDFVPGT